MKKLSLYELQVKDKKVLMRVDFNVPIDHGVILDTSRIDLSLPAIQYVLSQGGAVILLAHLGRPKGKVVSEYSLLPVYHYLQQKFATPVLFSHDCIGDEAKKKAAALQMGEILLLENLRFSPDEESPKEDNLFAKTLASFGDCFVNEAFSASHRAHSSVTSLPKLFPDKSAYGFLLDKEVSFLSKIALSPKRPFFAIIGGAKVSSKLGILTSLLDKIDAIFIGGGMSFTFLKAQGFKIGSSLCDDSLLVQAKEFLDACSSKAIRVFLPKDCVITTAISPDAEYKTVLIKDGIPEGWQGVDIGPKTIEEWKSSLVNAQTLFWNGPLGVCEIPKFTYGTQQIALAITEGKGTTVVGGGDSAAAIEKLGLSKYITHISTGGGASLEFIEFGHLPGIDALSNT